MARKTGTHRFRVPLPAEDVYRLLMASYAAEVRHRLRPVELTGFTLDKLWHFARYLTAETPRFGALFCGRVGNGKTTLLHAFQSALNLMSDRGVFSECPFRRDVGIQIVSTKDLIQIARTDWGRYEQIRKRPMLAVDELGEEPRVMRDYGNDVTPVIDLLEHRYNGQLFTLTATNLTPAQLTERYGARVGDRFREMMEVIAFGDEPSYRR